MGEIGGVTPCGRFWVLQEPPSYLSAIRNVLLVSESRNYFFHYFSLFLKKKSNLSAAKKILIFFFYWAIILSLFGKLDVFPSLCCVLQL